MVQLEVQKIGKTQLRINLFYKSEVARAIQKYTIIDLPPLQTIISEITRRIPETFLNTGPDIDLLEKLKAQGQSLFQVLFGEIGAIIRKLSNPGEPLTMVIILDDTVSNIPFELLYTGDSFLWEGFFISRQVATLGFMELEDEIKPGKISKMTIVGDPSGDTEIEGSIREELYQVSEFWEPTLDVSGPYFGNNTNLYRMSQYLSTCDLFHFSGHYVSDEDGRSGWLMDRNRRFTASDISSLAHLPVFIFANTCGETQSTAHGGFIREFLDMGVRSVLTTIGTVPTKQASYFSQLFYAALQVGLPAAAAVYKARNLFIKRFGLADLSWMFYVLYGDGNFQVQISKSVKLRRYGNGIKLGSILISLAILIFIGKCGLEKIKSRELHITTTPSGLKLNVGGSIRGITPLTTEVSPIDDIDITATGFDISEFKLKKIDGEWLVVPNMPELYILARGKLTRQYQAEPGELHVTLVKKKFYYITFKNLKSTRSVLMVQGNDLKLTADRVTIAVDDREYRYIIEQGKDVYDNLFRVTGDIELDVADIADNWQKNRFK